MAYVRLAPLPLFLLTTFLMLFSVKHIEAVTCPNSGSLCSPFEMPPCRNAQACRCIPWALFGGSCVSPSGRSVADMINEHPNLCQSNDECIRKGSGSHCARYPNPQIEYGWCINADYEPLKGFLKMPSQN